jgi:hypothetical protein
MMYRSDAHFQESTHNDIQVLDANDDICKCYYIPAPNGHDISNNQCSRNHQNNIRFGNFELHTC